MLQQARDEAHRFAITFQRTKRSARTITSELLQIPGVGPTRRRALLHKFGSLQGVREATLQDIAELPGFGEAIARAVHRALGVLEAAVGDGAIVDQAPHAVPDSTVVDATSGDDELLPDSPDRST
jgi:excinuclease ABC subunit C